MHVADLGHEHRGEALRAVIRHTVGGIERDLETELGASPYAQLRKLLLLLNETETETIKSETPTL